MIKLENIADVAKAFHGLGGHFKKMAEHHTAMHDMHKLHADFAKGVHDGMADDHEHKAYFGKVHAHHSAMAEMHKTAAAHHQAMHDDVASDKVAKTEPPAADPKVVPIKAEGGSVEKTEDAITTMIDKTVQSVTEKALDTVAKSGKIEEMIEQIVLKRMNERLGSTIVPDNVKGTLPSLPAFAGHLVPRPGQLEGTQTEETDFPVELGHFGGN